jgi:hypothetical protein
VECTAGEGLITAFFYLARFPLTSLLFRAGGELRGASCQLKFPIAGIDWTRKCSEMRNAHVSSRIYLHTLPGIIRVGDLASTFLSFLSFLPFLSHSLSLSPPLPSSLWIRAFTK